jgi:uncharacterized membrane protein
LLSYAIRYVVVLLVMIVGDAAWLSYFARAVFRPTLGSILRDPPNWGAAVAFYLLYAIGVVVFAIGPALQAQSLRTALIYGVLFGLMAYMTYDMTNLATIKVWTLKLALIDTAWGALLTGAAAAAGYAAARASQG